MRYGRRGAGRRGEQGEGLVDRAAVPPRAVLLLERHQLSVDHSRRVARALQQHQRQQRPRLVGVGHQVDHQSAEADRLEGHIASSGVV